MKNRKLFLVALIAIVLLIFVIFRACSSEKVAEVPNTLLMRVTLTSSKGYTVANVVTQLPVPHYREISFTMGNNTTVLKDGNPISWQEIQSGDLVLMTQYEMLDDETVRPSQILKYGALEIVTP